MCSKLGQKDARLESIRTRLPRVNCSQRLPHRAVCSPSARTLQTPHRLHRADQNCPGVHSSVLSQPGRGNTAAQGKQPWLSFHYCKRTYCLFFSEQAYIIHHLSHLQTLPHIKNTIQEGHLILQRIKSIFHRFSIDR